MRQDAPTGPESRQQGRPSQNTVIAPVEAEIRRALHSVPPEDALDVIGTDRSTGLSPTEAERRRAIYGENWLERRGAKSIFLLLIDQVRSLIVWLLFAAAALSLVTNDIPEAVAIICVLVKGLPIVATLALARGMLRMARRNVWHVFNMRGARESMFVNSVTANPYIWAAIALCIAILTAACLVPELAFVLDLDLPGGTILLVIVAASFTPLIAGQFWLGMRQMFTKPLRIPV